VILINLLPHREAKRRQRKQAFFVGVGMAVAVGLAIAGIWYMVLQQLIANQQARNQFLKDEIARLDLQIKDIASLRAEIDALKARQRPSKTCRPTATRRCGCSTNWSSRRPRVSTSRRSSRRATRCSSPAWRRPTSACPNCCATCCTTRLARAARPGRDPVVNVPVSHGQPRNPAAVRVPAAVRIKQPVAPAAAAARQRLGARTRQGFVRLGMATSNTTSAGFDATGMSTRRFRSFEASTPANPGNGRGCPRRLSSWVAAMAVVASAGSRC
jgi:hypothetical protein